jgi:hypothetical protein
MEKKILENIKKIKFSEETINEYRKIILNNYILLDKFLNFHKDKNIDKEYWKKANKEGKIKRWIGTEKTKNLTDGMDFFITKINSKIPIEYFTPEMGIKYLLNFDHYKELDKGFDYGCEIENLTKLLNIENNDKEIEETTTNLYYIRSKAHLLISARDFIILAGYKKLKNGLYYISLCSVTHEEIKPYPSG